MTNDMRDYMNKVYDSMAKSRDDAATSVSAPAGAGEVEEIARTLGDWFSAASAATGPSNIARSAARAILALGYRRGSGWQTIETAPKDGTNILVPGGIAYWRDRANGEHEAEPGWFTITAEAWPGRRIRWEVTHWQPLPAPPEQEPKR